MALRRRWRRRWHNGDGGGDGRIGGEGWCDPLTCKGREPHDEVMVKLTCLRVFSSHCFHKTLFIGRDLLKFSFSLIFHLILC